jgi:hypothetical protein
MIFILLLRKLKTRNEFYTFEIPLLIGVIPCNHERWGLKKVRFFDFFQRLRDNAATVNLAIDCGQPERVMPDKGEFCWQLSFAALDSVERTSCEVEGSTVGNALGGNGC